MNIGIVTVRQTTLIIDTSGIAALLNLEQMGDEDHPIALKPGVNNIPVSAGAYRVLSNDKITIKTTTDTINTIIVISFDKDDPGDPPKVLKSFSPEVRAFFSAINTLGESAPP